MKFLTEEFLKDYPSQPEHMSELGAFTAYRTYTRWLDSEQRRETWKEAVTRAVEYSFEISERHLEELKLPYRKDGLKAEAEALFDNVFNLRQFLSGRTHWVGGANTKVADKFPLANFNCSFVEIKSWRDLSELFYLLLVGTGVGFKATKEGAKALGAIRKDVKIEHKEYTPIAVEQRLENTKMTVLENGYAKVYVGDSKEGWVEALQCLFDVLSSTSDEIHTIKFSYNSIRPKGEKLKTFGGTASGYEPLRDMFEGIGKVIRGDLDPLIAPPEAYTYEHKGSVITDHSRVYLRPVHILDIGNLIGNNVVVGGVRRTAEIFLADHDDWESILAKYGVNGIWDEANHKKVIEMLKAQGQQEWAEKFEAFELFNPTVRPMFHRRMSNNSIGFETKPSREMLNLVFTIMQGEGEPGFVNLESANKRRPNAKGLNPCAEILLDSYGVCNLTTVNVRQFVQELEILETDGSTKKEWVLDLKGLELAQALSARAGVRMTLLDLEIEHWNAVHKRDRLTGTSLTGWYDAMSLLGYDEEQEKSLLALLRQTAHDETLGYATSLRIPIPMLVTTVKPEGTLSQVAGGVSSGLHRSHSPYYKRRIRINSNDALVDVAKELGWTIHAEVGTAGYNDEENLGKEEVIEQANTLVISFPVESGSEVTKDDISVKEQFDTYFMFQEYYSDHNSSNTITVKPDEWEEAEQIVWDNWDDFIGVSFLAHSGGNYTLAPYQACTKEEYEALKASMGAFDVELLHKYERGELGEDIGNDGCENGICPVR